MKVISLDENKIRKIVSETLKRALKRKLSESNFYNPEEDYNIDDFISDYNDAILSKYSDDGLHEVFTSLESEWYQHIEDKEHFGETADDAYFSSFKNFKDFCQTWINGVVFEQ